MRLTTEMDIHATDFSFCQMCGRRFGINRGIYNTIDSIFYERGIRDIVARRKLILSFLEFAAADTEQLPVSRLKFGHGGLAVKLNEFCSGRNVFAASESD